MGRFSGGAARPVKRPTQFLLLLFGLLLLYAVFALGTPVAQAKMPDRQRRDIFLVVTGVLGLAGGLVWRKAGADRGRESTLVTCAAVALPFGRWCSSFLCRSCWEFVIAGAGGFVVRA